jgi:3-deoxy-D-manno-octulosonic-acid transferase
VQIAGSLKADAPPLPVDGTKLAEFLAALGTRPLFLAASTHPGEEEIVFEVAEMLRGEGTHPLTVIVPRHPERGKAIVAPREPRGPVGKRRAAQLADIGLWPIRWASSIVLLRRACISRRQPGAAWGQNPLEPARLVWRPTGPHTENFADIFRTLLDAQGVGLVTEI